MALAEGEGTFDFEGWPTWYRVVGEQSNVDRLPVLTLHGGPGMSSAYLSELQTLTAAGRQVIFYDQVGSVRSPGPVDPDSYDFDLFIRQIEAVIATLGLDHFHLFGQSWGGMLALEIALRRSSGLASLVLGSALASVPFSMTEINRLADDLGIGETVRAHSAAGTTDSAEYFMAFLRFANEHLCRLNPLPDYLITDMLNMNRALSTHVFGRSDFVADGVVADWDVVERLGDIDVPTLVTGGRYDECTPAVQEQIHAGIPGSHLVIFEESAHMNFAEEPDLFRAVVNEFLDEVEAR